MQTRTLYFESKGEHNTAATLEIARQRLSELGIKQVVVASSHGATAIRAAAAFLPLGAKVIAVSINYGWQKEGWVMTPAERAAVEAAGVQVFTSIHALGDDLGTAFTRQYGGRTTQEIVRDTLYRFSQGMKVAVECVLMVADAGLLDLEQEVLAIAGSDSGADTAIIVKPATTSHFFDFEIREILAKPRQP